MKRGNPKEDVRPISWCVGGCQLDESKYCINTFEEETNDQKEDLHLEQLPQRNLRENSPLLRGVLVRSTSYQALHSALARLYRLDDFTLERIGQGFFSEVYKARHIVTGKIMVLKMNKLFSNRHNMLREVELMNRLHHPNILNYFGVCVHEGQVHALTQYINGGTLDALLQNLRIELPWLARASLALDITRGMVYLHTKDVFHRDLTSKNILIKHSKERERHRLRAVIADFGLAAPIPQDRSVRLRQVGSPYWMAPEVIRGDWYDHRIDIFSFGIVLCEMIARCDADPDVLPRTPNFGVHYLAFSHMCQRDCPPSLLEMAFQCCQIDPDSRPSFKELETLLYYFITDNRPFISPRKQKVYHRRSLSDDSYILMRNHLHEGGSTDSSVRSAGSPQEVLERISAADPYFQPSSATVNPFSSVKLPAKSQLIVQDGGRYCHSMPADIRNSHLCQASVSLSSSAHLTTSDTSLSQGTSSKCPTAPCNASSQVDVQVYCNSSSHCRCNNKSNPGCKSAPERGGELVCMCGFSPGSELPRSFPPAAKISSSRLFPGSSLQDSSSSFQTSSGTSPRPDAGGGTLNPPFHPMGGAVRRRGSGESGFYSVEDELCLSYSELSSASFVSTEEDDPNQQQLTLIRSPSVVTDSSEDLSSIGCGHDLASLSDSERPASQQAFNPEGTTDIKSIVEFFERGFGSLRSISESERSRKLAASARRKECLVPILRSRFNANSSHRSFGCSFPKHQNGAACLVHGSSSKSLFCTKEKCRSGSGRSERKEMLRLKDRPKVYITEGTVRAKRNIFESK